MVNAYIYIHIYIYIFVFFANLLIVFGAGARYGVRYLPYSTAYITVGLLEPWQGGVIVDISIQVHISRIHAYMTWYIYPWATGNRQ